MRRDHLADLRLRLLAALASLYEDQRDLHQAEDYLQQVLGCDPTREDIHRRLMRLYMRLGSRHAALRQYQLCGDALWQELGADPEEETVSLRQSLLDSRGLSHQVQKQGDGELAGVTRHPLLD